MRTFLQVQEDIFVKLKQVKGSTGFWDEDEVKDAINDVYNFIAEETSCLKFDDIIRIQVGIRTYKLPEYYITGSLYRVEFDNEIIWPVHSSDLDDHRKTWRTTESDPTNYFLPGDISASDEISVYPKPITSGAAYNLASESEDRGVVTTVGDTSYEEFNTEEGVIIDSDGEGSFEELEGTGPVLTILDPTGNLRVFGARYPKRLFNDDETFLHPLRYNPRNILTKGALTILFGKEGEGKDIQKSSYYNKRYMEAVEKLSSQKIGRNHRMRSVSESVRQGNLNLGDSYPSYQRP